MIIGIGSDLCNIERIARTLERHAGRFEARVFTTVERARSDARHATRAASYAKRFAAKEALSKALGTGFRQGVALRDIGVVNRPCGAPMLDLSGGARQRLDAITPPGHTVALHLTLTDDFPWAMAVVVIEAFPLHDEGAAPAVRPSLLA